MIPMWGPRMLSCTMCLLASTVSAESEIQRFESPPERATVVELFTSHGCSSCPPADEWLRRLSQLPGLWSQVIPLAFHVDYWDYLGWRDRFAAAEFSRRQRDYRRTGALGSVYTPGVLVNGNEWRGWYHGRPIPDTDRPHIGQLHLEATADDGAILRFTPGPDWQTGDLRAHLAILGSDLESAIEGGENRGRTLREAFVVLALNTSASQFAPYTWRLGWPQFEPAGQSRLAVAAWLSSENDPAPLQAVGGWLADPAP